MIISYKKLFFWHVLPWLLGWSAVLYYMLVMQQPFNWRTLLCFMLGWWLLIPLQLTKAIKAENNAPKKIGTVTVMLALDICMFIAGAYIWDSANGEWTIQALAILVLILFNVLRKKIYGYHIFQHA